ncbi:hypothetical protein ACN47A_07845, partial [Myxococcus fulvus]|uniref:hypothetical protein n=1 Tax=Myxococcus fulvus TaxID=33 RepID=UPI003B9C8093
ASILGSSSSFGRAEGASSHFELRRYTPHGGLVWTRSFALRSSDIESPTDVSGTLAMSVSTTGRLYLMTDVRQGTVSMDTPSSPLSGLALSRFNPEGRGEWSLPLRGLNEVGMALVASRDDGAYVSVRASHPYSEALRCAPTENALYRISAAGTVVWRQRVSEPECGNFRAEAVSLATLPDGGVALGGSFFGTVRTAKGTFTAQVESPFLATFSADGQMTWFNAFPSANGRVTSIGSSAKGTLVAAGVMESGALQWGSQTLRDTRSFLLVAEATGTPRWVKSLGRSEKVVIAVEPAGRVVVSGLSRDYPHPETGASDPAQNPQLFARRFNLEGRELWNRFFLRAGGPPTLFSEQVMSAAPSGEENGNTLLFGHFSHLEDFGTGNLFPDATDTFLLKLGPGDAF